MTLEIEGDPTEVGRLLGQLSESLLEGDQSEEETDDGWWTADRAEMFVRELTEPALKALQIISQGAPRVEFRELQRKMGVPGPKLAGRLSSIGFAVARTGGRAPFIRDYYQKAYFMDADVAKTLVTAIDREIAERQGSPARTSRPVREPRKSSPEMS